MASLSLFYSYYFGRCSSELAQLVPLPFSWGRSTCYSDRLHDISVTIPRCYTDVYVNGFFPRTARLWNSLPKECFPLTYDLSGFKSRINRHLLTVGSFQTDFLYAKTFFVLLFLVTPCLVVAVQPCIEWIPILKKERRHEVDFFNADKQTFLQVDTINWWVWQVLPKVLKITCLQNLCSILRKK